MNVGNVPERLGEREFELGEGPERTRMDNVLHQHYWCEEVREILLWFALSPIEIPFLPLWAKQYPICSRSPGDFFQRV